MRKDALTPDPSPKGRGEKTCTIKVPALHCRFGGDDMNDGRAPLSPSGLSF